MQKIVTIFKGLDAVKFEKYFADNINNLISDKNIYVKYNCGEAILNLIYETDKLPKIVIWITKFFKENDNENC